MPEVSINLKFVIAIFQNYLEIILARNLQCFHCITLYNKDANICFLHCCRIPTNYEEMNQTSREQSASHCNLSKSQFNLASF